MTGAALSAEAIGRGLRTAVIGRPLRVEGEVDSTNARLRALARDGAAEGTVVIAEGQTAGHGRRGQAWFSPPGVNLYASVLLRPRLAARELGVFSFMASLALTDAIAALGLPASIKWPNDVLVDGKKVAGTLVESGVRGETVDYVILGVGVNINVDLPALHEALGPAGAFATSLAAALGRPVDRNAFAASYLNRLEHWLQVWRKEGPAALRRAWADRDNLTGRRVEVRRDGAGFEGRVAGVDEQGSLVVDDTLGRRHTLASAEIRLQD